MISCAFIGNVKMSKSFLEILSRDKNFHIKTIVTKTKSEFNSDHYDLGDCSFIDKNDVYYFESNLDKDQKKLSKHIKNLKVDYLFCFGWSNLLKDNVLKAVSKTSFGFHPAKLPANRGRHPIIWAKVLGLNETASSFFELELEADTGAIFSQVDIPINEDDCAGTIYQNIDKTAKQQFKQILNDISNNKLKRTYQSFDKSNHWRKRSKDDGRVDWRMRGHDIKNLILALYPPYPGATFFYDGEEVLINKFVSLRNDKGYENIEPGKIINKNANNLCVKCSDSLLEFEASIDFSDIEIEYLL